MSGNAEQDLDDQVSRRTLLRAGGAAALLLGGGLGTLAACMRGGHTGASAHRAFGISIAGSQSGDVAEATALGDRLGRRLATIGIYVAWEWAQPFPRAVIDAIAGAGAVPEITWEPWNPGAGVNDSDYRLSNVYRHQPYIDSFARAAAGYGGPLFIRLAHEMNATWYPWCTSVNGNSPADFVTMFRYVRSRFDVAGATNVKWVWCANVVYDVNSATIEPSYPGDAAVDVVALDGYNRNGQSAHSLFGASITVLNGIAPDKPLWINEVGTIPGAGAAAWITDFFAYLATTRVGSVMWFEVDPPGGPDWRLTSSPDTLAAAATALRSW